MERIIKFTVIFLLIFAGTSAFAQEQMSLSTLISPQNIKYDDCTKVYNIDNITLFYQTIASINANRFKIDEIQSRSGYILFTAVGKKFLATVSNVNTNQAMLKITPTDGNYYFQPGIIQNIFKFIDINKGKRVENINFK